MLNPVTKLKNKFRGFVQKHAPSAFQRMQWDREYSNGRWNCLSDMPTDILYRHVEKYCEGKTVLDMGCGPGPTAVHVKGYKSYLGVDVSEVCLQKAREVSACRPATFTQGNLSTYEPEGLFDVIVIADSLYYVPHGKIDAVLDRLTEHLAPGGVIVMRTKDDDGRRKPLLAGIEKEFIILEKYLYWNDWLSVLIFRERMTVARC